MALWEAPVIWGLKEERRDEWGAMETIKNTWGLTALPPMVY